LLEREGCGARDCDGGKGKGKGEFLRNFEK